MVVHLLHKLYSSSLHRNASFIIVSYLVARGLGFVFWTVAANLFLDEQVGIASALISVMNLIAMLSILGLDIALIRFFPQSARKLAVVRTSFFVASVAAAAVAAILRAGMALWSRNPFQLGTLWNGPAFILLFVAVAVPWSVSPLMDSIFIASRRADFVLGKNMLFGGVKLCLIFLFVRHGFMTIFGSWVLGILVALVVSILVFFPRATQLRFPAPRFDKTQFKTMFHFSLANYVAAILFSIPFIVVPLIVAAILGAEMTAYYYIGWVIVTFLLMIPSAIGRSFLAEGSTEANMVDKDTRRSLKFALLLVIPSAIILAILAEDILLLFGNLYAENASSLVRGVACVVPLFTFNEIFLAKKNIEKRVGWVLLGRTIVGLSTGFSSVLFLDNLGLIAVAYGFAIGHAILFVLLVANNLGRNIGCHCGMFR